MSLAPLAVALIVVALVAAVALGLGFAWQARRLRRQLRHEREQAAERLAERESLARAQAIATERERIYGDLHDDLGAKLLGMIHGAENAQQADRARAVLQDLRDVVTRSRGAPGTLGDVLAQIRAEASQRLVAAGIGLAWEEVGELPDPDLDPARTLHLYRIVREAISNVIRHAQAQRLRVRVFVRGGRLYLDLTDDGSGAGVDAAVAAVESGSGLRNMRERAAELAGDIRWSAGTLGGTKVLLGVPLEEA